VLSNPEAAPDVLHVDCSYGRPTIETAVVRTQPDGLHVAFRGTEGYAGFEIVTPEGTSPEQFFGVGGNFPDHEGASWPIDPGRWEIGCHERGETVSAGDGTTPFELVDPETSTRRWICLVRPVQQESASDMRRRSPRGGAAQLVAELAPDDRLRDGGYDAEDFKLGPTYVVERGGQTIARLTLGAPATTAGLWTCEGSGIALARAARRPADGRDDRAGTTSSSCGARVLGRYSGVVAGRRPAWRATTSDAMTATWSPTTVDRAFVSAGRSRTPSSCRCCQGRRG
jgi:hypothetical protein